jgi:hypothetical protein
LYSTLLLILFFKKVDIDEFITASSQFTVMEIMPGAPLQKRKKNEKLAKKYSIA